ncbi:MAG: ATP-binding protein [Verrucomicrobiae bacterium]|nr:ATP-binding protein [Verrucomicrobiae bacterium]
MTRVLFFLVLLNGVVTLAAAAAVWRRNRQSLLGPLFGVTLTLMAAWMFGFAFYYYPLADEWARWAAYLTLSFSITTHATWFHTLCALAEEHRRLRGFIVASYLSGVVFLALLWSGHLIVGLRDCPYMERYVHYNRALYPWLMTYLLSWQFLGVGLVWRTAQRKVGYQRTQLTYFLVAWCVIFLTTTSIIIPLEYNVNIPPFGFFVLPFNLVFLAYVMAKARLADYNIVIARFLLHSVTLIVVTGVSLVFIAAMTVLAPGFLNQQQILFTVMLVTGVGLGLAVVLPRWLPRAERIMQERFFGRRYGYQDALAALVQRLGSLNSVDEVLQVTVQTVHEQMRVTRVLLLLQDPLSGNYQLRAQSGLTPEEASQTADLMETSAIVSWLQSKRDALVLDELPRRETEDKANRLRRELEQFKAVLCVPMILDEKLIGVLMLGPKTTNDMFFVSDLRLLQTVATEVALAIKYRRLEEEILRKNKLIELGTLAAGVAHEIRNPLASIRTFAQLMRERMDDPEFRNEFSQLVMKDVDRITKVIESMLAFARPSQVTVAPHSVQELVEEAVLLAQPRLKSKRIELTKQFHETPVVKANKQQILQVLLNLINNAVDALPESGGKIRIATGSRWIEPLLPGESRRRAGVIEVSDNGPGIPPHIRNRLFDPFFTTKKEGTGLGLSISQKIVRDHGGIITVSSIEGKGATFQVSLPLADEPASAPLSAPTSTTRAVTSSPRPSAVPVG